MAETFQHKFLHIALVVVAEGICARFVPNAGRDFKTSLKADGEFKPSRGPWTRPGPVQPQTSRLIA
jgi:hypothetical protein